MSDKDSQFRNDLQKRLDDALAERVQLRAENERLRGLLGLPSNSSRLEEKISEKSPGCASSNMTESASAVMKGRFSPEQKIVIFRNLFRGREDVYPVRWESKNGKSGYSPACANAWKSPLCGKPKVKCGQCENRSLLPVDDQVVFKHLSGKQTIGVYPLLADDTCWFLAADFDKKSWQEDALIFLELCREMEVPAILERSRSGKGGHVWIFFDAPVPAASARKLGCALLTRAMESRRELGLDSYDRFFPNQDTLPKGGFGNLIALPLQYYPRASGNSIFLDPALKPYQDQWSFLAGVARMSRENLESLVLDAGKKGRIVGVRSSVDDDGSRKPWTLPPSGKKLYKTVNGSLPSQVSIIQSNQVYVEKDGLPSSVLNCLSRLAAFQNPEFYKAQAMRLSTFGKPRVIACAEEFTHHLALPRGCLDETLELFKYYGMRVNISDQRFSGNSIKVRFNGVLTSEQKHAAKYISMYERGVLSAATAFGKTVIAAWLIAERKVNTLILVHRRQLMDQWHERLSTFLDLSSNSIGRYGGGKTKTSGGVDIATLQSLNRKGEIKDMVADYGQIIVDECHHVSAFSFEQVLRKAKAKYVCGLTATPIRKDGHQPIIFMQCGPVRFRVDPKKQAAKRSFEHIVLPRQTGFAMPLNSKEPTIQEIYTALSQDEGRNEMIFNDILKTLDDGRSPILLTNRVSHVDYFEGRLQDFVRNIIVLKGGMGKRQRESVSEKLAAIPDTEERLLVATGSYIGEGFDDSRLDTLFLAAPVSWRVTLQQYAGRLHRLHHNKRKVIIYDYVDEMVPQLARMYNKRLAGYRVMGYEIH
jgi:superfamily II DNA or RNA helicase